MDYGAKREDIFSRCVCHPVVSPEGEDGKAGSITPCLFRRGNHPENAWLSGGEPNSAALTGIIQSETYREKMKEQNDNLQTDNAKCCPRCRKVPNNIFLDILFHATPLERTVIRAVILLLYPRNPIDELIKGLH